MSMQNNNLNNNDNIYLQNFYAQHQRGPEKQHKGCAIAIVGSFLLFFLYAGTTSFYKEELLSCDRAANSCKVTRINYLNIKENKNLDKKYFHVTIEK